MLFLALVLAATVLAVIQLIADRGRSVLGWSVILLAAAALVDAGVL